VERFELTIVAQGPHAIWIALLVVALLCVTAFAMLLFFRTRYRPVIRTPSGADEASNRHPRFQRRL
jgi:hypothetical protein